MPPPRIVTPDTRAQLRLVLQDYVRLLQQHADRLDVDCAPFINAPRLCRRYAQLGKKLLRQLGRKGDV